MNAHHVKRVPGRKTDVQDAEWLADLLQHGLLQPSFIPPVEQRDRRDLTRQRTQLVRDRVSVVNRLHKVLETGNIKLSSVATDLTGVSSRRILEAIVQEQADPTSSPISPSGAYATNCPHSKRHWRDACVPTIALSWRSIWRI